MENIEKVNQIRNRLKPNLINIENEKRFVKLSRDSPENTKIMAGQAVFTVKQLDDEMLDDKSEVGRKLRSIEHILENY